MFSIELTETSFDSFRPQQGLAIMNYVVMHFNNMSDMSFRPQQGLAIMNVIF